MSPHPTPPHPTPPLLPQSVAICWEQGEAARLLLQLGADPNQVGVPGSTRRGLEAQEREMAYRSATFVANLGAGFACVHLRSCRLCCQQMAWPLLLFTLGWCCPDAAAGASQQWRLLPNLLGDVWRRGGGPIGAGGCSGMRTVSLLGCKHPAWQRRLCRRPPYVRINSMVAMPFLCRCDHC